MPVEPVRPVAPRGPRLNGAEREKQPAAVLELSDEARRLAQDAFSGAGKSGAREPGLSRNGAATKEVSVAFDQLESATSTREQERARQTLRAPQEEESEGELSEDEQQQVQELEQRDREVRVHEQAHKAVGGQYAGAIHYDYQRGPDGQNYAIGGHVNIDASPVANDPSATLAKMQQVVRAALAPAEPSPADRSVAAKASGQAAQARQDLAEETAESLKGGTDDGTSSESMSFDALLRGVASSEGSPSSDLEPADMAA